MCLYIATSTKKQTEANWHANRADKMTGADTKKEGYFINRFLQTM